MNLFARTTAALLVCIPGLALAQGMPGMDHGAAPMPAATPAEAAYRAADAAMMEAMSSPLTGDPNYDFAMMMVPHHQGAIDMALVMLEFGSDPELRALAESVIAAQEAEIAQMRAWMAAHPVNFIEAAPDGFHFEIAQAPIRTGGTFAFSVRLVDAAGAAVPATITALDLNMSPEGMMHVGEPMAVAAEGVGVQGYVVTPEMTGRWELVLEARIGEPAAKVRGRIIVPLE